MNKNIPSDDPMRGIALVLVCFPLFSLLDSSAKYLMATIPVLQIVWMRYTFQLVVPSILLLTKLRHVGFRSSRPWLQCLRGACLLGTTLFNFLALQYLQLTQTMALFFAAPFLIALASGPLLGEWVGWRRLSAIFVGFIGVIIVINPAGEFHWAFIYSICAVLCMSSYSLITRVMANKDHNIVSQFYAGAIGCFSLFPFMIGDWVWPQAQFDLFLFMFFGLFGMVSHWFMVEAHKYATAGTLAPYSYTQILWMGLLGFFIFGDVPNMNNIIGVTIVIIAGVYLFFREKTLAKKRKINFSAVQSVTLKD